MTTRITSVLITGTSQTEGANGLILSVVDGNGNKPILSGSSPFMEQNFAGDCDGVAKYPCREFGRWKFAVLSCCRVVTWTTWFCAALVAVDAVWYSSGGGWYLVGVESNPGPTNRKGKGKGKGKARKKKINKCREMVVWAPVKPQPIPKVISDEELGRIYARLQNRAEYLGVDKLGNTINPSLCSTISNGQVKWEHTTLEVECAALVENYFADGYLMEDTTITSETSRKHAVECVEDDVAELYPPKKEEQRGLEGMGHSGGEGVGHSGGENPACPLFEPVVVVEIEEDESLSELLELATIINDCQPVVESLEEQPVEVERNYKVELELLQAKKQFDEFVRLNTKGSDEMLLMVSRLPLVASSTVFDRVHHELTVTSMLRMGRVEKRRMPTYIVLAELPRNHWGGIIPAHKSGVDVGLWRGFLGAVGVLDAYEHVSEVRLVAVPLYRRPLQDVRPWRDKVDENRDDLLVCMQPMLTVIFIDGTEEFVACDAREDLMNPAGLNFFGDTFQFSVATKEKVDEFRYFKRMKVVQFTGRTNYVTDRYFVYQALHISIYQLVELLSRKTLLSPQLRVSTAFERMVRCAAEDTLTNTGLVLKLTQDVSVVHDTLSVLACLVAGDAITSLKDF